jgi:hypothetical protein
MLYMSLDEGLLSRYSATTDSSLTLHPSFSIINVIWVLWCYQLLYSALKDVLRVACDQVLIGLADRRLYGSTTWWLKEDRSRAPQ